MTSHKISLSFVFKGETKCFLLFKCSKQLAHWSFVQYHVFYYLQILHPESYFLIKHTKKSQLSDNLQAGGTKKPISNRHMLVFTSVLVLAVGHQYWGWPAQMYWRMIVQWRSGCSCILGVTLERDSCLHPPERTSCENSRRFTAHKQSRTKRIPYLTSLGTNMVWPRADITPSPTAGEVLQYLVGWFMTSHER